MLKGMPLYLWLQGYFWREFGSISRIRSTYFITWDLDMRKMPKKGCYTVSIKVYYNAYLVVRIKATLPDISNNHVKKYISAHHFYLWVGMRLAFLAMHRHVSLRYSQNY